MFRALEAITEASPYADHHAHALPVKPTRGTVRQVPNDHAPPCAWAVLVYDGVIWVCIGHGQETFLQAADGAWALARADELAGPGLAS